MRLPLFCQILRNSLLLTAALAITGCVPTLTRAYPMKGSPVSVKSFSRPVDDEHLEFVVVLRNTGQEIVSFDYTIADVTGVPHVDAAGPNSGVVENLYPGAEVEVKNPWKRTDILMVPGHVVYGKLKPEDLQKHFNLTKPSAGEAANLEIPTL